jgi:diguanylate cyclase (GGDEF)-like protein
MITKDMDIYIESLSIIIKQILKDMSSKKIPLNDQTLKESFINSTAFTTLLQEACINTKLQDSSESKNNILRNISNMRGFINDIDLAVIEKQMDDPNINVNKLHADYIDLISRHIFKIEHRLNTVTDFIEDLFTRFASLQKLLSTSFGDNIAYVKCDLEQDKAILDDAKNIQSMLKDEDSFEDLQTEVMSSFDNFLGIFDEKIDSKSQQIATMNSGLDNMENQLDNYKKEVNDLKNDLKKYQMESITDHLTNLYNRKYLDIKLEEEMERYKRVKVPFSVVILDIDDFKHINDTYGHLVGDQVLKHIANITKNTVRKSDFSFRYGGEEFILLLINADAENAKHIAEQVRQTIEKTNFSIKNNQFLVTASFGVTEFKESLTPEKLIEKADSNMYRAKQTGKNKVVGD